MYQSSQKALTDLERKCKLPPLVVLSYQLELNSQWLINKEIANKFKKYADKLGKKCEIYDDEKGARELTEEEDDEEKISSVQDFFAEFFFEDDPTLKAKLEDPYSDIGSMLDCIPADKAHMNSCSAYTLEGIDDIVRGKAPIEEEVEEEPVKED